MASVLIIDDDFVTQTALQDYLEEAGYKTSEATSGEQGLELFHQIRANIILLDVEMPGIDGFETCRRIRRAPGGEFVPVVMMTGHEDAESVHRAYAAGATDFVSKPMNFAILVHRIQHLLETTETSAKLMRSRASLAQAQRIAKLGSWEFDVKKLEFHCSDEAAKLIRPDNPTATIPFLSLLRSISLDDRAKYKQRFLNAIHTEKNLDIDFRLSRKIGRRKDDEVYIHQETSIEFNDRGEPILAIGTFQDVTEIQATQKRIRQLAYFDSVTGLPNRSSFMEELENVLDAANGKSAIVALMFVDIDQFKRINDTWGHHVGDELLVQVAERLSNSLRQSDLVRKINDRTHHTLARLGGDEFVVLLTEIDSKENVSLIAERLTKTLKEPFLIENTEMHVSASIGVSCYPDDGTDEQTLLRHADIAMYQVKEHGRNGFRFYKHGMSTAAIERVNLENSLRRAIENQEFELFYQAKIATDSEAIVGAEALLRWQHPELGTLEPGSFIPTAEESGLIVPIGAWVIDQACEQLARWQKKFGPDFEVSINTSAIQFQQPDFLTLISDAIAKYALPAEKFQIEITESMLVDENECSTSLLTELRALRVQIAIDDFGTGYSSLQYLKNLPVTNVKIDRSFVQQIAIDSRDAGVVEAIISLGHHLGLTVTAEGVENRNQLKLLGDYGCDEIQGYYYCKPLPVPDFEIWFSNFESSNREKTVAMI